MPLLHNGDTFPRLTLDRVGGGSVSLPDDLAGDFGVVLIYRGSWCPYCNAQLAAFSRAADTFEELGINVVAFSVDDAQIRRVTAGWYRRARSHFAIGVLHVD